MSHRSRTQYASFSALQFSLLIAAGVMSAADVVINLFIFRSPLDYIVSAVLLAVFIWSAYDLKRGKLERTGFKIIRVIAVLVIVGTPFSWWLT